MAGFKKISRPADGWTVLGTFHPLVGTLWGDIRVSVTAPDGVATVLVLDVTAAVDNVYSLAGSRGATLAKKFLDSLAAITTVSAMVEA
ncbi:MAG TPA: hypothetical protein VHZ81_01150 [Galbitalea sp.]|jgi:hypothetical protein|nr:hypothetical protein [Galbitalea sp.]